MICRYRKVKTMADETQHHHKVEHSLLAPIEDLESAASSYMLEYDHSHESGDTPHSHEHNSPAVSEPKPTSNPEPKKTIWFGA